MILKQAAVAALAALVILPGAAEARPHRHRHWNGRPAVIRSFPIRDADAYRYNNQNVYKTNRSSYSRYPSSRSYYNLSNDGYYYPSPRSYSNGYYNDGYSSYYNNGYYYNRPGVQLGPLRINF